VAGVAGVWVAIERFSPTHAWVYMLDPAHLPERGMGVSSRLCWASLLGGVFVLQKVIADQPFRYALNLLHIRHVAGTTACMQADRKHGTETVRAKISCAQVHGITVLSTSLPAVWLPCGYSVLQLIAPIRFVLPIAAPSCSHRADTYILLYAICNKIWRILSHIARCLLAGLEFYEATNGPHTTPSGWLSVKRRVSVVTGAGVPPATVLQHPACAGSCTAGRAPCWGTVLWPAWQHHPPMVCYLRLAVRVTCLATMGLLRGQLLAPSPQLPQLAAHLHLHLLLGGRLLGGDGDGWRLRLEVALNGADHLRESKAAKCRVDGLVPISVVHTWVPAC
jgi:hypothetical protein